MFIRLYLIALPVFFVKNMVYKHMPYHIIYKEYMEFIMK